VEQLASLEAMPESLDILVSLRDIPELNVIVGVCCPVVG
jgi:hypothetical protein